MEQGENNMNQTATPETTSAPAAEVKPADNKLLMGILAYLSILVVIPYLIAKNDSFVKFHIRQGLVLVVVWLAAWVLSMVVWGLYPVLKLVEIVLIVLSIIGIVNVVKNEEKELPVVGQFAKHFNI